MRKTPFRLPPGWLRAFGYPGSRRFVALFWEPCGDECCYDDGERYACGCCDGWLYLDFKRQPQVQQYLFDQGIHLGNSDERARHWLIADAVTGELYAAPAGEAQAVVRQQQLPPSAQERPGASESNEVHPMDEAEANRRQRLVEINAQPGSREALEAAHGQVWDTQQLRKDFEVVGFLAPVVVVRRRSDGRLGSLEFQHSPRFFFHFQPHEQEGRS